MSTVLIVAAHPDDEALGCGGAMARHAAEGDDVHVVFMADGVGARGQEDKTAFKTSRNQAALNACQILGAHAPLNLNLPDNQMDTCALLAIVQQLEPVIDDIQPEIIYTHHGGDLNIDHELTQRAVLTACRPMPQSSVQAIYSFEVRSATEWAAPHRQPFIVNRYVDISQYLNVKLKALDAYAEEMRNFPHTRSNEAVKAMAVERGASVGMQAAEAFSVVRQLF